MASQSDSHIKFKPGLIGKTTLKEQVSLLRFIDTTCRLTGAGELAPKKTRPTKKSPIVA